MAFTAADKGTKKFTVTFKDPGTGYIVTSFPKGQTLEGIKVVIDCANGAAYKVAPTVLWELGAEIVPVGVAPDGFNINRNCGSLATETMRSQVALVRCSSTPAVRRSSACRTNAEKKTLA